MVVRLNAKGWAVFPIPFLLLLFDSSIGTQVTLVFMNWGGDLLTAISAMMGCVGFVTRQLWWIKGKGPSGLAGAGGTTIFLGKGEACGAKKKYFWGQSYLLFQGLDEWGPHFLWDLKSATDQSTLSDLVQINKHANGCFTLRQCHTVVWQGLRESRRATKRPC